MKKYLLVLLVSLGLQTQAQMNVCDSMTNTGSHFQPTISVNNINTIIDYWITTAPDGTVLGEDSLTNYHTAYNYNPTGSPYDTITTCITWGMGATNTCCVTWIWDATMWLKMSQQTQINYCDSLSYSILIDSTTWYTLMVTGNADGVINMVDSIDWYFTACNALTCYTAQGNDPYHFPFITPQDTVKLCYDAYVYYDSSIYTCTQCDSLVYDFMTDTWVVMSMSNPTGIEELMKNEGANYKMYDLLGRELTEVPVGVMYIRNNKKYIKIK